MLIGEALARTKLPVRWTYEVGRSTTALDLVGAGVGVAPLPLSAMAEREDVAWKQMIGPEISRPIGLLRRVGQRDSSAAATDNIRSYTGDWGEDDTVNPVGPTV